MYGLHYVALRYANGYGPRQNPHGEAGVVSIFGTRCLRGEECSIFGDGGQARDFVYVADVVRANLAALSTDFCGYINIGTGLETDVNRVYALIAAASGFNRPARHLEKRLGEARRSAVDASLAGRILGWRPEMAFTDGIRQTEEWFRTSLPAR